MIHLMNGKTPAWTGKVSEVEGWMLDLVEEEYWWFAKADNFRDVTQLVVEIAKS